MHDYYGYDKPRLVVSTIVAWASRWKCMSPSPQHIGDVASTCNNLVIDHRSHHVSLSSLGPHQVGSLVALGRQPSAERRGQAVGRGCTFSFVVLC